MVRRLKRRWLLGHRRVRFFLSWVEVGPPSLQKPGEEAVQGPSAWGRSVQPGGPRAQAVGPDGERCEPACRSPWTW